MWFIPWFTFAWGNTWSLAEIKVPSMKFCFIVRIVNWRWHAGIEVLKKVGVHMRKRRTHQERGGKKPRITNVCFSSRKKAKVQGSAMCSYPKFPNMKWTIFLCARAMMFPHINPIATWYGVHYYVTDVEAGSQRGWITCSRLYHLEHGAAGS